MILSAQGLSVELPARWEGRVFTPSVPPPALNFPVMHASNFPLPADSATFASAAAGAMGGRGVLLVFAEYDPALAGFGLFAPEGLPLPLRFSDFYPMALQVTRPNQAGLQRFLTTNDRAFCLYVVLGTARDARESVRAANLVLRTLSVRAGTGARRGSTSE